MAVDLEFRLSGGSSNSNPLASTGGVMSSVEAVGSTLWDAVTSVEAAAGDTEYRCLFITNNGADTAIGVKLYIQANTPSADTEITIALDGNALNADGEVVANESTAPTGESFVTAANLGAALDIGNLAAGDRYAFWIRRVVTAGADGSAADTFNLRAAYDYVP